MMVKTHKAIALTTAGILQIFDMSFSSILYAAVVIVSAGAPDMDIVLGIKHRQFTHSLMAAVIFSGAAWIAYRPIGVCVLIGYGTHILSDSFTKMGVPVFYPYRKMYGARSITTGSTADWMIFWMCTGYIYLKFLK